jgi:glucosamine-phosphate N-acetyltransferase
LVAEPEGGGPIVACGSLVVERCVLLQRRPALRAHIEDIVVDKSLRGCGLGKVVISHLLAIAADSGCDRASLNCSPENSPFYERCGLHVSEKEGLALYF